MLRILPSSPVSDCANSDIEATENEQEEMFALLE
jgi:hypothetical protein